MEVHIDHAGIMRISIQTQGEVLLAPDGKKYLPCWACMKLETVAMNVVSTLCDSCARANDVGALYDCEGCGHPVKAVQKDERKPQVRWVPSYAREDDSETETVLAGDLKLVCPCCGWVFDSCFVD